MLTHSAKGKTVGFDLAANLTWIMVAFIWFMLLLWVAILVVKNVIRELGGNTPIVVRQDVTYEVRNRSTENEGQTDNNYRPEAFRT
jgi:inner membrane protein involved in colicin E2 resistance